MSLEMKLDHQITQSVKENLFFPQCLGAVTFLYFGADTKIAPQLGFSGTRSFDCAHFWNHQEAPSGQKTDMNIYYFQSNHKTYH